ncbi:MAG: hypothetical protein HYZ53_08715 [Planctomycetes bacterium]|nr:hypothetical protein [Planctomycetota bacterium]
MRTRWIGRTLAALALWSGMASVYADGWVLRERQTINELRELGGVPNYDQMDFPGNNDCGPTAALMLLGYWDAHGWPALVHGGGPYVGAAGPSAGLKALDQEVKALFPYTGTLGTVDATFFVPFVTSDLGARVRSVATGHDSGAAAWGASDDEDVSRDDVRAELRAGRPMMLCVEWTAITFHWNERTGPSDSVRFHYMTVIGFEDWHIDDWATPDDFWVALRSGWRRGGDSVLWYNWSMWDDLYEVRVSPAGVPARPQQVYMLWSGPGGQPSVWGMDGQGNYLSSPAFAAYATWTPTSYERLGNGGAVLLRSSVDGRALLETLDANDRVLPAQTRVYPPVAGGTAVSYRRLADDTGRLLWSRADGSAELWRLGAAGEYLGRFIYTNPGMRPVCYDKLPDGKGRMLWEDGLGRSDLWTLNENDLRELAGFSYVTRTYSGRAWFDGVLRQVGYRDLGDGTRRLLEITSSGAAFFTRANLNDDLVSTRRLGAFPGWVGRSLSAE